ncbi:uncharacterized protein [Rutidosis leptorrhynchoides]|uniref:uncharacterized protein n=1 Tax=Rutidosis leptorrhynchoides TaxID=125765 RepID=UPI003A999E09
MLSIPNFNSQLPPNPNPNPSQPQTNVSYMTISHGFNELLSSAEITTHSQTNVITSESTQSPTVALSAGNLGAVVQPVANEVISPKQPFMCEVCKVSCDTKDVLEKHNLGKKHIKNMKKLASSSSIAPDLAPQRTPVIASSPAVVSSSSMIAPEMTPQQAPVVAGLSSMVAPEMAPQQPPVVVSSSLIAPQMALQQASVVANSASMTVQEMAPKQPPIVASPSSMIAQEMAPQPPPVGNDPSVAELENKKKKLLQNGASVDTLLYCYICNVVCNNEDVYRSHVSGKKHAAKAALMQAQPSNDGSQKKPDSLVWCELCKISCTGEELLQLHLAGKKHLKKVKRSETLEYLEKLEKTIEPNATVATEQNGKRAASNEDVQTEQNGKRAAINDEDVEIKKNKKQKVEQEGGVSDVASRTCTMCNLVCNSPTDFRAHLSGKKHAAVAKKQAEAPTTGQAE